MALNITVLWAVLNITGEYLNTTVSRTNINNTDTLLNKTVSRIAINTTNDFVNNRTTLEEIYEEDEQEEDEQNVEEEDWEDEWPYFNIFGKTYFSFIVIIVSLGLVGNVLTFILMSNMTIQTFAYTVYMRWIAVSDSTLLILIGTEDVLDTYGSLQPYLAYHVLICKIWTFFIILTKILSPWLVVALTLDRFVCVVLPLSRYKFCTKSKAVIMCSSLTLASAVISIDQLKENVVIEGVCQSLFNVHLEYFHLFINLVLTPLLPCLIVFILNVIIVIRIRQSTLFRESFRPKSTKEKDERKDKKDKATRPLVLISVFAFITLIPISVTQAVEFLLDTLEVDTRAIRLASELWPLFNLIYLLNFGQNFYIMMASSPQYRKIIKKKLSCFNIRRRSSSGETNSSNTSTRITHCSMVSTQITEFGT